MAVDLSDCREVEKTIKCSKAEWAHLFTIMRHMHVGSEFSPELAAQVNQALGHTPLVREDLSLYPPDKLMIEPQEVNNTMRGIEDGNIKFGIASWVPVKLELIGFTMGIGGCGVGASVGGIVPGMLKLHAAYIEKPGPLVATCEARADHVFEPGETLWCQFTHRRFFNVHLVISKQVATNGKLVGGSILVDSTLQGHSQYLLFPAVCRRSFMGGCVTPAAHDKFTLEQLNVAEDIPIVVTENVRSFFQGDRPRDMVVELRSHTVHIHDLRQEFPTQQEGVFPLALCGESDIARLQEGSEGSQYDIHGSRPRIDVTQCLDHRQRAQLAQKGSHIVGIIHNAAPKVWSLPERSNFDGGSWWEGPTNHTTVLHRDSACLMLPIQNIANASLDNEADDLLDSTQQHELSLWGPVCFGDTPHVGCDLAQPPLTQPLAQHPLWWEWGETQQHARQPALDTWTQTKVGELLPTLAHFQLKDESRSGKLGAKGLGIWDATRWVPQDGPGRWEEVDMVRSFWARDPGFRTPKLFKWATTPETHQLLQHVIAISDVVQQTQLASTLCGLVRSLLENRFGCLILQQFLHEAIKMAISLEAATGVDVPDPWLDSSRSDAVDMIRGVVVAMKQDLCEPRVIKHSSSHRHGSHVIKKWIDLLLHIPGEQDSLRLIAEIVAGDAPSMGSDLVGCRMLTKILDTAYHHILAQRLLENQVFAKLVTDEFGNYVIGALLDDGPWHTDEEKLAVLQHIVHNFSAQAVGASIEFYATHKYARHVTHKCLVLTHPQCSGAWTQVFDQLVRLVFDTSGGVQLQFDCLRHTTSTPTQQILGALSKGLRSRPSPQRSTTHRV